jgi:pimeloyl-ACP methyl ester carboxylesterase
MPAAFAQPGPPASVKEIQTVPGTGFRQYSAGGANGQRVTFYLSDVQPGNGTALPLVVWVQGTGCSSHFMRNGDRIGSGLQNILKSVAGNNARVLVVEKPGVEFLDPEPESLAKCRPEFLADFTLDAWGNTIATAITATQTLPGIDRSRTLVIGHSEGAIVALRVANLISVVTHVAALSGGGPVALFTIAEFVRRKRPDLETEVYKCWAEIEKDPESTSKFCWGGTYRQWSSFMKTSVIEEALRSRAQLYFAHGSADEQNTVLGFDVLRAELAAKHRDAFFDRIEGADHALDLPGQSPPDGFTAVFGRVVAWFLTSTTNSLAGGDQSARSP